jgi:hypothetical protein
MAELADALASGASGGNPVEVQVLLPAPTFLTSGVTHNFAVVAERQTRQLEGLVRETSCGFKSRQPHQLIYGRRSDNKISYAGMAELADALASGASGGNPVEVQVLLPAPFKHQKHVAKATCFFSLYTKKEEPTTMHSHGPPPLEKGGYPCCRVFDVSCRIDYCDSIVRLCFHQTIDFHLSQIRNAALRHTIIRPLQGRGTVARSAMVVGSATNH